MGKKQQTLNGYDISAQTADRMATLIGSQQEKLREQDELLQMIKNPPFTLGVVLVVQKMPLVNINGNMEEIPSIVPLKELKPGNLVRISVPTMERPVKSIIEKIETYEFPGEVVIFLRWYDHNMLEVDHNGSTVYVFSGRLIQQPDEGDRLLLDRSGMVVLRNLGQPEVVTMYNDVYVPWDMIGGQEEAKAMIQEALEMPSQYSGLFDFYNKKRMPGIVLYGPPGNGKTLLGKAAATSIQQIYGKSNGPSPFMYVKGAELLSRYVGNTESAIRSIFARAKKFYKKFGMPMVVFFDEAEALFRRRGSGISSDISDTIVPAMLAEMQGFGESGAFVMLATNRIELMDPAIIRDGRVGGIVEVKSPTPEVALDIFRIHLSDKPVLSDTNPDDLAQLGTAELFNPERRVGRNQREVLAERVSGAMIEGVVERAISIALHRDIESRRRKTGSGICAEDMIGAIAQVHGQQMALN